MAAQSLNRQVLTREARARRRPWRAWIFLTGMAAFVLGILQCAHAVEPDEILADPGLEARARHISQGLRCLVCQNQSIDDSQADLARDLRVLVRERLRAGDSDAAVLAFITARYGDFVLLRPPLNTHTLLLWIAPILVLALAAVLLVRALPGARATEGISAPPPPLTPADELRLSRLLNEAPQEFARDPNPEQSRRDS